MKTYGVYLVKNRTKSVLCNYNEFFIIPTITIGKADEIDYHFDKPREATKYFVTLWWLNFNFSIEAWGERKEKGV